MTTSKHHYIPKCYLKAWNGADGMLCEYQKPYQDIIVRRRYPSETGWLDKAYTIKQFPIEREDILETALFFRIDQEAENALSRLLSGKLEFTPKLRDGLSRFLMSLMHRNPPKIEDIRQRSLKAYENGIEKFRERYLELKTESDPELFEDYLFNNKEYMIGGIFMETVNRICDSKNIGQKLNLMKTFVHTVQTNQRFLTSDRPLLTLSGLGGPDATLLLPISPRKLLCCAGSEEAADRLQRDLQNGHLLEMINTFVVLRAHRYVYGICENRIEFVREHFGRGLVMPWDAHAA